MNKQFKNKKTLLVGEGINQHTLYGDFQVEEMQNDFFEVSVKSESHLKHEEPNGKFAEHKGLMIEKGEWKIIEVERLNPINGKRMGTLEQSPG